MLNVEDQSKMKTNESAEGPVPKTVKRSQREL